MTIREMFEIIKQAGFQSRKINGVWVINHKDNDLKQFMLNTNREVLVFLEGYHYGKFINKGE